MVIGDLLKSDASKLHFQLILLVTPTAWILRKLQGLNFVFRMFQYYYQYKESPTFRDASLQIFFSLTAQNAHKSIQEAL